MNEPVRAMGFEWVLFAMGAVLTLVLVGFFLFVLLSKDERKNGGG